jgi:hypothetical protein
MYFNAHVHSDPCVSYCTINEPWTGIISLQFVSEEQNSMTLDSETANGMHFIFYMHQVNFLYNTLY